MLPLDDLDTIAASAGPPGPALRGLIRLSGPDAISIARVGFEDESGLPSPTRAEARSGRLIVRGFGRPQAASIVHWPGHRTYTGQPMAEVHIAGAPPIVSAVLAHYLAAGARLAEPGEFTLRAFLSGRIDLTQSEAVLGVIDAGTPAQLQAALEQLAGGLAGPITRARDMILDTLAHLEANLDFAEEPDVDPLGRLVLAESLANSADEIGALADRLRSREVSGTRPRVVLCGPPNAGKSRLFNALVGADHAIVSHVPGTTRDYVTGTVDCEGLTVELVDTAGLEEARDAIESGAQRFRAEQVERADLRLVCAAPGSAYLDPASGPSLRVRTMIDLGGGSPGDAFPTSAATGVGLAELRRAIADALRAKPGESDAPAGTGVRCRDSLHRASEALRAASDTIVTGGGDELVAVDLRQAAEELGRVVGAVVTDDILDRIFRRFCIGK